MRAATAEPARGLRREPFARYAGERETREHGAGRAGKGGVIQRER